MSLSSLHLGECSKFHNLASCCFQSIPVSAWCYIIVSGWKAPSSFWAKLCIPSWHSLMSTGTTTHKLLTRSVWLLLVPGCKPETGLKWANERAKTHSARQGHSVILGEIKKPGYISHMQRALSVIAKVRITKCGLNTWESSREQCSWLTNTGGD